MYRKLPMPMDLPPVLERTTDPWSAEPLKGKTCLLGGTPGSALSDALRPLLERAGASVATAGDAHLLVCDVSAARKAADLEALYSFVQGALATLRPSGRIVVIGTRADLMEDAEAAGTQEAIVGFTRSLAKEVGKRGATAHALFLPVDVPTSSAPPQVRLAGPLLYLLSARSAFVSGQVLRLSAKVPPPAGLEFPETAALRGKKAIVTGAARGIGAVIAAFLAREGALVLGVDHPSQREALDKTMKELNGRALVADLADDASLTAIEQEITSSWGSVDVLINNAGITRDKSLAKMARDQWTSVLRVNLEAPTKLTNRLAASGLLAKEGRVVFLSSVVGIAGNFGQTNYSAAKAGLLGVVAHLAPHFSERSITVNAIAPGYIATPMTQKMPFVSRELARRTCSLKQGGLPEDVAQAATFLASPGAFSVTGQVLRVCGQSLIGA